MQYVAIIRWQYKYIYSGKYKIQQKKNMFTKNKIKCLKYICLKVKEIAFFLVKNINFSKFFFINKSI